MLDGLDPVPAWRHAHVDERESVGAFLREGGAELLECFLTLKSGVHVEAFGRGAVVLRGLLRAEEDGLVGLDLGVGGNRGGAGMGRSSDYLAGEYLAKVRVDLRHVVD